MQYFDFLTGTEDEEEANGVDRYNLNHVEQVAKASLARKMAPSRGTSDWFKHLYTADPMSPDYWTEYNNKKSLKAWALETHGQPYELVQVDPSTFSAVEQLVHDTWQSDKVGKGRDAMGLDNLKYSKVKVEKVERVENCALFYAYALRRQELLKKGIKKCSFKPLENIQNSSGEILTTKCIPRDSVLSKDIYREINEHYMFHGTQAGVVDVIMKQGLDQRLAGTGAMFGQGTYTAESSTKSDQYAGRYYSRGICCSFIYAKNYLELCEINILKLKIMLN